MRSNPIASASNSHAAWFLIPYLLACSMSEAIAATSGDGVVQGAGGMLRGVLYGAIVGLAGYQLLLGVIRRSAKPVYGALTIASLAFLSLAIAMPPVQNPHGGAGASTATEVLLTLVIVAAIQFTRGTLGTANRHPRWDEALLSAIAISLTTLLVALSTLETIAYWMWWLAGLSGTIAIAGAAWNSRITGDRAALPLLLAVLVMAIGGAAALASPGQIVTTVWALWFDAPLGVLIVALLICASDAKRTLAILEAVVGVANAARQRAKTLRDITHKQQTRIKVTQELLERASVARRQAEHAARSAADGLARAAGDDAQTGLPNLALFNRQAEVSFARARRQKHSVAIVSIEFDQDGLADAAEFNELMFMSAQRLTLQVRACDVVGRAAPARLVLALGELASAESAASVVRKLSAALNEPLTVNGRRLTVFPRIGYAMFPARQGGVDTLIQAASEAAAYVSVGSYVARTAPQKAA